MSPSRGWHSRGHELLARDRDLIGLVVLSSTLSCWRAFEGVGCRTLVVGHW